MGFGKKIDHNKVYSFKKIQTIRIAVRACNQGDGIRSIKTKINQVIKATIINTVSMLFIKIHFRLILRWLSDSIQFYERK